uniref:Uncharacterized protein n=1 Tax=Arundo donax TaxID=35708 RepID=A0A0A9B2E1_ARUDO
MNTYDRICRNNYCQDLVHINEQAEMMN